MLGHRRVFRLGAAALAIALSASIARAEKKSSADYQKLFEAWSVSIAEIQKTDTRGSVVREIETLRTLVNQAQAFQANDKLDEIEPIEERVDVMIRFTKVKVQRVEAERRAAEAENAAREATGEAERAQADADATVARFTALEKQGL
jgi:pantothenate kinase-related protein Tda10